MQTTGYLSAREAARELGIRPATLYAYVSRGLIRSEAAPGGRRARRYRAEDVWRLRGRREGRRDPAQGARRALHWGDPVLESAITLIADGRCYYRGHDALDLAASRTAEEVAELIWTRRLPPGAENRTAMEGAGLSRRLRAARAQLAGLAPLEVFQALLPLASAEDPAAYDQRPAAVARTGARILRLLALIASGIPESRGGLAATLAAAWRPRHRVAARLIDAALVLCADHELNVSAFAARCVASAGATPYAVVTAGMAALTGVRHGGQGARVEALLAQAGSPAGARSAVAAWLRRGEALPGFGQPLYPEGDPRGAELLRLAASAAPRSRAVRLSGAVVRQALDLVGERPNLDFGLAVLSQALRLPPGAPMALFALGRTIGWIGHAIEQYQLGTLIRPRARYIGEQPVRA